MKMQQKYVFVTTVNYYFSKNFTSLHFILINVGHECDG